jgi:hypothetical protein
VSGEKHPDSPATVADAVCQLEAGPQSDDLSSFSDILVRRAELLREA